MVTFLFLAALHSSINLGKSFVIVPSEFPLLLQLVYSKIPPIRTGTDSKLGFGFRIGRNADLQMVFELGPQENISQNKFKKSTVYK